ncbi:hypothetical protein Cenrod_2257 [Candidatus Symbiobacter mobilis CR]|uniref:Uncharacterized protein n=1 Tax=Candidatus Symbiobacter mobilis CR TaxID=946483 RepID=U5N9S8_9BURK|nr:hypothetical protein Cenrod_2257 [Candidatus Symbiobacter mobilis CR]
MEIHAHTVPTGHIVTAMAITNASGVALQALAGLAHSALQEATRSDLHYLSQFSIN